MREGIPFCNPTRLILLSFLREERPLKHLGPFWPCDRLRSRPLSRVQETRPCLLVAVATLLGPILLLAYIHPGYESPAHTWILWMNLMISLRKYTDIFHGFVATISWILSIFEKKKD